MVGGVIITKYTFVSKNKDMLDGTASAVIIRNDFKNNKLTVQNKHKLAWICSLPAKRREEYLLVQNNKVQF